MSPHRNPRLPISTRHAFALAFDLAVRRDPLHSLLVPLLLHAPWIIALGMIAAVERPDSPQVLLLGVLASAGDFLVQVTVGAMLRFRARSVFNTPAETRPAPAHECYANGLGRVPWLLVTEMVRNALLVFAAFFFVIPAVFLGFRLSFATEAVVLNEPHLAGAFQRSFRYTEGRFERWLEMIVCSVFIGLSAILFALITSLLFGSRGYSALVTLTQLTVALITPIVQYAWTFFYLRLVEIDEASQGVEAPPAYAAEAAPPAAEAAGASPTHPPLLTLIPPPREPEATPDRDA